MWKVLRVWNGELPPGRAGPWTRRRVYAEGVVELLDVEEDEELPEVLLDVVESPDPLAEEGLSDLLCARLSARESVR